MAATQRTGFTDAALVRLLARLGLAAAPAAPAGFAQRLGAWLRWTDAPPLYAALHEPLAVPPLTDDEDASPPSAEADCRSVHALLLHAITHEAPWQQPRAPVRPRAGSGWLPAARTAALPPLDWPAYRRYSLAQQQAMEDRIAALRARLRRALQLRSPALARLAALDEVMQRMLTEPEQRQLAALTTVLEQRYLHWQAQADALVHAAHAADIPAATDRPAWQTHFEQELHAVLLAELDLRWQPIHGLLAALRAPAAPAEPPMPAVNGTLP
ncbi:MAG: DUF3348 family protein [Pseudomonadota bacterium]|nr:DUF3348 family protein [Pseudomonadota bacterium]